MFARISTYKTSPDTLRNAPADDIIARVLQLPGCKGIYYLNSKESDKALSITLWDTEESMVATRQDATRIREETSEADKTHIVSVEEFEVTANSLNT
jgi:heme-degrading monooxygenase HmoA